MVTRSGSEGGCGNGDEMERDPLLQVWSVSPWLVVVGVLVGGGV